MNLSSTSPGRALVYIRKSVDTPGVGPQTQLEWAMDQAQKRGLQLEASIADLEALTAGGMHQRGSLFLDHGISGSVMGRPGLQALVKAATEDAGITHILVQFRDRWARPEDPLEAVQLENLLRKAGKTFIFSDRELKPIGRSNFDVADAIMGMLEYQQSHDYLVKLSRRVIEAQILIAKGGGWAGGRAPYGFGRVLVDAQGEVIRELADGESVRDRTGRSRVSIRPRDEEKLSIWIQILRWRASHRWGFKRIANVLNEMGVPSPDAGRQRRDRYGHPHDVSGRWSANTVKSLTENRAIVGQLVYGSRSEGIVHRGGKDGPRTLTDDDFSADGKPRVVRNPEELRIVREAGFEPVVDPDLFEQAQKVSDPRSVKQLRRSKAKDPNRYPLSGRVFDASENCGWPMYGTPLHNRLSYVCGQYHTTSGSVCNHNRIDVTTLNRLVLSLVRSRLHLTPENRQRLEQRLGELVRESEGRDDVVDQLARLENDLRLAQATLDRMTENLALESNPRRREAIQGKWDEQDGKIQALEQELILMREQQPAPPPPAEDRVQQAMADLDRLADLAAPEAGNLSVRELAEAMDLRVWMRFRQIRQGKKKLNLPAGGLLTSGDEPWPIQPYHGSQGGPAVDKSPADPSGPSMLNKVNRGDRI